MANNQHVKLHYLAYKENMQPKHTRLFDKTNLRFHIPYIIQANYTWPSQLQHQQIGGYFL